MKMSVFSTCCFLFRHFSSFLPFLSQLNYCFVLWDTQLSLLCFHFWDCFSGCFLSVCFHFICATYPAPMFLFSPQNHLLHSMKPLSAVVSESESFCCPFHSFILFVLTIVLLFLSLTKVLMALHLMFTCPHLPFSVPFLASWFSSSHEVGCVWLKLMQFGDTFFLVSFLNM